jgi:hypothetical protein
MRVSEFGRWFRFISVVSLMLCGFSINSWAQCTTPPTINTTIQTATIGPNGQTLEQDVPATATVLAGSTVTLKVEATAPGTCSHLYFQWQYWSPSTSQWLNFPVGLGQSFFGATVSNATDSDTNFGTNGYQFYSAPLTISGIPTGFTQAVNAGSGTLLISATTTDDSISNSTRSNTVTINVVSQYWFKDSPGGPGANSEVAPGPDAPGTNPAYLFANLPSNSGTYERGTLLPSGHIFAIGFDPASATHTEGININITPGIGDGLTDYWVPSSVTLAYPSTCNIGDAQRSTTTLLPNGSVLIAGGLVGTADTAAACLWTEGHNSSAPNPWTPGTGDTIVNTGSMTTARDAATATLLGNGMVLIAGGASNGRVLNTAELYNPATGTFTAISASMTSPRYHHTATLLANGLVLIVGGHNTTGANTLDSAELYDPVANKFTATAGTLWAQRAYHAATLLADGNVLVTGGVNEAGLPLGSAEIYDTADGTFFQVTAPMVATRSQHTATLMQNGKVLIAGGAIQNGFIVNSEYFDPTADGGNDAAGTFAATVALNVQRDRHASWLVPSGMVVTAGGTNNVIATDSIVSTAEKFGDVTSGAPVVPNGVITFSASPVFVGQTVSAFCGPHNANGTSTQNSAGFNNVSFAWVIEGGGATNITYPNWPDTAQITFTVTATGGTVEISCLATSIYGIPNTSTDFLGESYLTVSGTAGLSVALTSNPTETTGSFNTFGLGTPDATNAHPTDYTTIPAGTSVNFIATVSLPGTFTYTWQVSAAGTGPWTTVPGSPNTSVLSLTGVPVTADHNIYQVIATGPTGTVTSNQLTLLVVGAPQVAVVVGPKDMGPPGSCTAPLNPPVGGGASQTPCAPDESAEAALTVQIIPSPMGSFTNEEYQWCTGTQTPTPFIGGSGYTEYYVGFLPVNTNLASNLCSPNFPAPGTGAGATNPGPFGSIYPFDLDTPPLYADSTTYTPTPAAGVSPTFYAVAFDAILGVDGAPVASNRVTETVYSASPVTITNNTSCPAVGDAAPLACAGAGSPQVDPTVDQGQTVTLQATFTGAPYPVLNTDPSYSYTWVYENAIQGWKTFPTSYCVPSTNCSSIAIPSALVGSDGLQIQVYVTNSNWPGYVSGNPVASVNLETSGIVDLQVIPNTTVTVAETATNEANLATAMPVPSVVPAPIQGHSVVFTATIVGADEGGNCPPSISATTAVCVAPVPNFTWYREAVNGTEAPATDPVISNGGATPANNVGTVNTCDSTYTIGATVGATQTLTIHPLCLGDQGYTYYAVAGYTENDVTNYTNSPATLVTVNWDQVHPAVPTSFDALAVMLPASGDGTGGGIYGGYTTRPTTESVLWIAGGQNASAGVQNTSGEFESDPIYDQTTDHTESQGWTSTGSFLSGPHLDATATLFLSNGAGTEKPYIAIVGGSDGQDGQSKIEYFGDPGGYVTSTISTLPPITQHVAALLPSESKEAIGTYPAPNQEILIAGGQNGDFDTFYGNLWLLTPGSVSNGADLLAASKAQLSLARASSRATTLADGRVLITGGVDYQGVDNAVDIYDSSTGTENTYVEYPLSLYNLNDSRLPTVNTGGDFVAQAICPSGYHTASWATATPTACLETPRLYHTQTLLNTTGNGLCPTFGGEIGTVSNAKVLITGGIDENGNVLGSMELWDPCANKTTYGYGGGFYPVGATATSPSTAHAGSLLTPRMMASAVLLPTGNVLVFGGEDPFGNALTSAEIVNPGWIYNPSTPLVTASAWTNSLTEGREQTAAALLPNGEVIASGGVTSTSGTDTGEIFDALQAEGSAAAVPSPEVDTNLVYNPAPTTGTAYYAWVSWAGNTLLNDYSWYVQNNSGPTVLAITEDGVAPLSGQIGYTPLNTGTYTIDSLVSNQYGLSYLLSDQFTATVPIT